MFNLGITRIRKTNGYRVWIWFGSTKVAYLPGVGIVPNLGPTGIHP